MYRQTTTHLLAVISTTLWLTALLWPTAPLAEEAFQPLEEIRDAARQYVMQQLPQDKHTATVVAGRLDVRLRLTKCSRPLEAKPLYKSHQTSNRTVNISCSAPKPWSIYVPVRVKRLVKVLVSRTPLQRNQPIEGESLRLETRELSTLGSGYYSDPARIIGKLPRRNLNRGSVISPGDLMNDKIIRKGNRISIVAKMGGITVRMPGKALADAAEGEIVKVENISSKRTVEGEATAPGIVTVRM